MTRLDVSLATKPPRGIGDADVTEYENVAPEAVVTPNAVAPPTFAIHSRSARPSPSTSMVDAAVAPVGIEASGVAGHPPAGVIDGEGDEDGLGEAEADSAGDDELGVQPATSITIVAASSSTGIGRRMYQR